MTEKPSCEKHLLGAAGGSSATNVKTNMVSQIYSRERKLAYSKLAHPDCPFSPFLSPQNLSFNTVMIHPSPGKNHGPLILPLLDTHISVLPYS